MDARGIRDNAVEIKEDGVVLVAPDALAIWLRHESLSGLPKHTLTQVTLATDAPRSLRILDREHVRVRLSTSVVRRCRRRNRRGENRLLPPRPARDLGNVVTIAGDELLVVDELSR